MKLVLNSKKVFLTNDMNLDYNEKMDIVLSPEFYWVRVFDIPVKYVSQVKKIVPNFYEDIVSDLINEISYKIIKIEENKFMCFAYDNKKIFEFIKNTGINLINVNRVYFAQTECSAFRDFYVGEKTFFYTKDNILVKAPKNKLLSKNSIQEEIEKINLSSHYVDIKFYKKIISPKQISYALGVLLLITTINFWKGFEYSAQVRNIDSKIESIKKENNIPSSIIQTNTIVREKSMIKNKEVKKRELLEYLLNDASFKFKSFQMKKDGIDLFFSNHDKKIIDKLMLKKYKIINSDVVNKDLNIRIEL